MSASPARFVTLEGGEGAGKSTQAKRLAAALQAKGIAAIVTREPGGSPGAEEIRKLLVEGEPGRWDATTETLLMFAARADHVAHKIMPALRAGQWVVCDRFTDSTYAYQGAGRGVAPETIAKIQTATLGTFKPDFTLILDLPVEVGLKRTHGRPGHETRFERFDESFHQRLRAAFQEVARHEPQRCAVIEAQGTEDGVAALIWNAVRKHFNL